MGVQIDITLDKLRNEVSYQPSIKGKALKLSFIITPVLEML